MLDVIAMSRTRLLIIASAVTLIVLGGLAFEVLWTQPERGSIRTFAQLLAVANRPDLGAAERLEAARSLCSTRYLQTHSLAVAAEGGLVGIPRTIHMNFQAWRQGPNVWICPKKRVGPVYQFIFEKGRWRFDGPVGILVPPRGDFVPTSDFPEPD
jgi:hypothetical protein